MNIEQEIKTSMAVGIDQVLSGRLKSFDLHGVCPDMVKSHMESLGFECGELDTNGWQYDWWLTFVRGSDSFTASGSGYYGNFEFSPTES